MKFLDSQWQAETGGWWLTFEKRSNIVKESGSCRLDSTSYTATTLNYTFIVTILILSIIFIWQFWFTEIVIFFFTVNLFWMLNLHSPARHWNYLRLVSGNIFPREIKRPSMKLPDLAGSPTAYIFLCQVGDEPLYLQIELWDFEERSSSVMFESPHTHVFGLCERGQTIWTEPMHAHAEMLQCCVSPVLDGQPAQSHTSDSWDNLPAVPVLKYIELKCNPLIFRRY